MSEWPLENYAVLGQWLISQFNAQLFITGGPEEMFKSKSLYGLLRGKAIDMGGRLSWLATISLVKKMDIVVSVIK